MNFEDTVPHHASAPPPAAAAPAPAPAVAATAASPAASSVLVPNLGTLERLVGELLRDRRTERRWRLFFRMVWLLLAAFFLWGALVPHQKTAEPHTALVELRGELSSDAEANAESIVAGLRGAFEDAQAQAVVLRINSPGGSPVQAGIIYDEILRLKALHQKKLYAVVEESCASGAYYVAVAADEIFVDKASIVGSIGVLMDGFGFTGTMDKLGIERRLLTAGNNKGMLDPFSPLDPRHRAYAQTMLEQIHQQFIKVVKEGRGKRLKETPDVFSGLFWNGEEAVRLGLADRFGNLDFVAREIVKAEQVIDYTPKENVAERLAKRVGASIGEGATRALRSSLGPVR